MLLKNPAFSLVAILTLALGIGANTAVFSVVDKVLLRPLPYPEPERLVTLTMRTTQRDQMVALTPVEYYFWLQNSRVFDAFSVTSGAAYNVMTDEGTQNLDGIRVTSAFFSAIGVQPVLGRGFLAEEDRPGAPPVIVLSYGVWRDFYGSASDAVGRSVLLNDKNYTIVGVLPDGFTFAGAPRAVYAPLMLVPDPKDRGRNYTAVARLKRGVTIETAQADTDRVYQEFLTAYPDYKSREVIGFGLTSYQNLVTDNIHPLLNVLLAAVGAVLLIACANVANLLLSRAAARRKEIVIRAALGAGTGRILRQLFVESLVLSAVAGIVGVLLAFWGVDILVAMNPTLNSRAAGATLDTRVFIFSAIVSLATGLFFGLSGALHARRIDPNETLKAAGTHGHNPQHRRLSNVLVVFEVALAMLLLVSASLLMMTFYRLQAIRVGFNTENLLAVELPMLSERYKTAAAVDRFERQLRESVKSIPGVLSVATASGAPLVRTLNYTASIEGQSQSRPFYIEYRSVSLEYFETVGIRISRGRSFVPTDTESSLPVVLINERLARRFPADVDPLGQRLTLAKGAPHEEAPREIVGIVSDVSDRPPGAPVASTVYVLRLQTTDGFNQLANQIFNSACLIRTAASVDISRQLRDALVRIDPRMPIARIRTIREIASGSIRQQESNMFLMSVFAGAALLLTVVGLYGVLSYQVVQRTREIGVRVALGASGGQILRIVLKRGMILAGLGIVTGIGAALGFTRLLAGLLYGVTPANPWIYIVTGLLLSAVAFLASYIPARRATRIDPLVALRYE